MSGRRRTLFLGLVCEHRTEGNITDALDVLHRGVELVIDNDTTLAINLDANLVKVEALSDGATTDGNKNNIGLDLNNVRIGRTRSECDTYRLFLASLGRLGFDEDFAVALLGADNLCAQLELDTLLAEDLLEVLSI